MIDLSNATFIIPLRIESSDRMRNIITGKAGDRTQIQTGWEKHKQDYQEPRLGSPLNRAA